jgi:hypothetical protein
MGHAGWHIIEAGEDGQAVYRLAHQKLADNYRGKFEEKQAQGRIAAALRDGISGAGWLDRDKYLWRHLSDHAQAEAFANLINDPGYLAVADPVRLATALQKVDSAEGRRLADLYNRVVDRLIGISPVERMPLIHMTAQMDDPGLAPGFEPPIPTKWRCRWADAAPTGPQRIIGRHGGSVTTVAWGAIEGRPTVASANKTVRLWDPRTGKAIWEALKHDKWVTSVAWGAIDEKPVIVSGSWDNKVRLWDPRTGEAIWEAEHAGTVNSVAWGVIDGRPVIVSGSFDSTTRLWEALATRSTLRSKDRTDFRAGKTRSLRWHGARLTRRR